LSDSSGYIYDPDGIDAEKLAYVIDLKTVRRGRIAEYADRFNCDYHEGKRPWEVPCELAFPCATQNEVELDDAKTLVANGCRALSEGANMPTTLEAIDVLLDNNILYAPGKAANAGGVAVSGLEMSQNSIRMAWGADELEDKLRTIMRDIHANCVKHGYDDGYTNYLKGANIAGFIKVADAMLAYGVA
ncbi:MAG: glutamate dehydrogenase, partial [Halioglobus sp.]|nr:glutamate dehydrogenase [Halioglobus sp.]